MSQSVPTHAPETPRRRERRRSRVAAAGSRGLTSIALLLIGALATPLAVTLPASAQDHDCEGWPGDPEPGTPEWEERDENNLYCLSQRHEDQASHPNLNDSATRDQYREPLLPTNAGVRFRFVETTVNGRATEIYAPCTPGTCSGTPPELELHTPPFAGLVHLHGGGSNKELHWWSSQTLAEAGYIVVTYDGANATSALETIDWLFATPSAPTAEGEWNPFWAEFDHEPIGIAGHSIGGDAAGIVASQDQRVGALVLWDRAGLSALPEAHVTPALCMIGDYGCPAPLVCPPEPRTEKPDPEDRGLKTSDFDRFRAAGQDTMQIGLRATLHFDWVPSGLSGNRYAELMNVYYMKAWYDRYVRGDGDPALAADAYARLTASVYDDSADVHNISQGIYDPQRVIDSGGDLYAGNVPYTMAGHPAANRLSFYYDSKCDLRVPDSTDRAISLDMRHEGCPGLLPEPSGALPLLAGTGAAWALARRSGRPGSRGRSRSARRSGDRLLACLCAGAMLLISASARALTITIAASDSGSFSEDGNHTATNETYLAGWSNDEYRNFFVFDVSGLPAGETILSATLRAYNPAVGEPDVSYTGGYQSPDASETYQLVEVLTPAVAFGVTHVGTGLAIYLDLADGPVYGAQTVTVADNGAFIEVALNAAGLAALDAAVGDFVLGGHLSSLTSAFGTDELIWGLTDPPGLGPYTRELVVVLTPEPAPGLLLTLGLIGFAAARRPAFGRRARARAALVIAALVASLAPDGASALPGALPLPVGGGGSTAGEAITEIVVLSNRADLISGGDALVEVVPPPPAGTVVDVDGRDVTPDFALRENGRYMGLVTGLTVGDNVLTVTLPAASGATLTIENHPPEGPIFSGPHLRFWDCTTEREGLGPPLDEHCNADPVVEWLYVPTGGGGYQPYDLDDPPTDVATTTTDQGHTVRHVVRHEMGVVARGIYNFAVLHDPDLPQAPWIQPEGWNGKLYFPFGASCNTNYTQGSAQNVLNQTRLSEGFAVATGSLNVLGHHCNTVLSAEAAMMTKERFIEVYGQPRFTISTGGSGGAIGQLQVSNMYPGITNGIIPSQLFPDNWSTGIEVFDCARTETYWPTAAIPFTTLQKMAVDGHGPPQSTCAAWTALYAPAGLPTTGCFGETTLPASNIPFIEERDYNPVTNPDGCRASTQDVQVNIWGRRPYDGFANSPVENLGVQYGLNALNLPVTDPGKITFAQFLDLNLKARGSNVEGLPQLERTRAAPGVTEIAYRSSAINDGRGLRHAAIIALPGTLNAEIHTPHHSYAMQARLIKANGHADNYALWHGGPSATAFATMDAWLEAVYADGGIDPLFGMDPQKIVDNRPAIAVDSCWSGGDQGPLEDCAGDVYGSHRTVNGGPVSHDIIECALKPIDPADYAGAVPPPTATELAALATIFPEGVCDYGVESPKKVPSLQWATYENGPGGEPLGEPPISTPF